MKALAHIYQEKPKKFYPIGTPKKHKADCCDCRNSELTHISRRVWAFVCKLGITGCPKTCPKFVDARKPCIENAWQVVGGC